MVVRFQEWVSQEGARRKYVTFLWCSLGQSQVIKVAPLLPHSVSWDSHKSPPSLKGREHSLHHSVGGVSWIQDGCCILAITSMSQAGRRKWGESKGYAPGWVSLLETNFLKASLDNFCFHLIWHSSLQGKLGQLGVIRSKLGSSQQLYFLCVYSGAQSEGTAGSSGEAIPRVMVGEQVETPEGS